MLGQSVIIENKPGANGAVAAGRSRDIVTRLNTELRNIIDNPDVKAQIAATGFKALSRSPRNSTPSTGLVKRTRMINDAGTQPE